MSPMRHTPKPLQSPRQYRALRFLVAQRCTVRFLWEHAGGNGIPQLISTLRKRGLRIEKIELEGQDRDGQKVRFCEYELQPEPVDLAKQLLAMEGAA